jgi:DnaJ-class molecular chaperone
MGDEKSNRADGQGQVQACETCQMCQGTGLMAFVLPNLLHEEITCPNCDGRIESSGDWVIG